MIREDIVSAVKDLIISNSCLDSCLDIEKLDLSGKDFFYDLKYDSLSAVILMTDIEKRFGIVIDNIEEYIDNMNNCETFINWICTQVEENAQNG